MTVSEAFAPASVSEEANWIKAVTGHMGSRPGLGGKDGEFMRNAAHMAELLVGAGYGNIYYGDGDAGTMGGFGRAVIKAGGNLNGGTLDFFLTAQGQALEGAQPTEVFTTMHERMQWMRANSQAAIVLPGSYGTMEEAFEWLISRSDIVKPQIIVNYEGYWKGLKQFLNASSDNRYRADNDRDVKRLYLVESPEAAIEKLNELNASPAIRELDSTIKPDKWENYVFEEKHALLVTADSSLSVMSRLLTLIVTYDVSNIKDQTVFKGDVIKPAVFSNEGGVYDGLFAQLETIFESEFSPQERRAFFHLATGFNEAADIAAHLDASPPLLPEHLDEKHAEATSHMPQAVRRYMDGEHRPDRAPVGDHPSVEA